MKKFWLALFATVIVFLLLRWQSAPLVTETTRSGILALEFCDSIARLREILSAWNTSVAQRAVVIDFGFILCFGLTFYSGCEAVYRRSDPGWLYSVSRFMLAFCFVPPLLDVIENILMLFTLSGSQNLPVLHFTRYVAISKFVAAAIVVLYLLVSLPRTYAVSKKTIISE